MNQGMINTNGHNIHKRSNSNEETSKNIMYQAYSRKS